MVGLSLFPPVRSHDVFNPFDPGQQIQVGQAGSSGVSLPVDRFSAQLGLSNDALAFLGAASALANPQQLMANLLALPTEGRDLGDPQANLLREAIENLVQSGAAELPPGMDQQGLQQLNAEDLISLLQSLLQQNSRRQAPQPQSQGRGQARSARPARSSGSGGASGGAQTSRNPTANNAARPATNATDTTKPEDIPEQAPVERANGSDFATRRASMMAAREMVASAGINIEDNRADDRLQVGTAIVNGAVHSHPDRVTDARNYIDQELDAGRPVIVGVDFRDGSANDRDGITDHFVVITGRGEDENGNSVYRFDDPGRWDHPDGAETSVFYTQGDGNLHRRGFDAGPRSERGMEMTMVVRNPE